MNKNQKNTLPSRCVRGSLDLLILGELLDGTIAVNENKQNGKKIKTKSTCCY